MGDWAGVHWKNAVDRTVALAISSGRRTSRDRERIAGSGLKRDDFLRFVTAVFGRRP